VQRALPVALAALALAAGCRASPRERAAPPASAPAPATAPTPAPALDGLPLAHIGLRAVRDARGACEQLERDLATRCAETPAYLDLRRHVARAAPFLRPWAAASAEVLVGPVHAVSEGAGALADLDGALSSNDGDAARASLRQIRRSLILAEQEFSEARASLDRGASLVHDAAYELSLALLEASGSTPASAPATLAHARGVLDAVLEGGAVLGDSAALLRALAPVREALDRAGSMDQVRDRARLARAAGDAASEIAALARARGLSLRQAYKPQGTAAFSALAMPARRARLDDARVALGARLFSERRLSHQNRRSCADCHRPADAFADGLRVPPSLDPAAALTRNTPTLLYAFASAAQRWDGRLVAPEDQALSVLHTRAEMGLSSAEIERVASDEPYRGAFQALLARPPTAADVGAAIAAYTDSLGAATSPLDRFAQGDDGALGDQERLGFDVFVGKGRCSRCHLPPLFGGARPPAFQIPVFAVLGVPVKKDGVKIDPDPGRGAVTGQEADQHAFKTPTLRNIARTAPYFHNGSFSTLPEVIAFYDKGGGKGSGVAVANQDPDVRRLELTAEERRALEVFLERSLTDAEQQGARRSHR
jgi:cytochrome c peroxidase